MPFKRIMGFILGARISVQMVFIYYEELCLSIVYFSKFARMWFMLQQGSSSAKEFLVQNSF